MASTIYRPDTMSSSDVKKMQTALINAGYDVGKSGADGIWGKDTSAALSAYKKATGGSNSYGNSVGNETFKKLYGTGSSSGQTSKPKGDYSYSIGSAPIDYEGMISDLQKQNEELQQQMAEYPAQMYDRMMSMISSQNTQNQAASRQRTQQLVDSITSNQTDINEAYKEAQRQAYINQALQKYQANDYLAANGYTGGMAESTLAQIATNYENNRRNAASERDAALRQNEQLIAEAQASGNSELAQLASDYTSQSIAAMQNQAQMNYQMQQAQREQTNADREYQLMLMQQKLAQQQYEDELAASKASQDFNTFLDTYQGKYNKQSTYQDWINNLKAKKDPYGYNAQKIAYLTQYINSGMGKSNASSGSSSLSSGATKTSSAKTGTTQNSSAKIADYDQILKTASLIKSTNSFYGPQGAADYIEKSGLTDYEKNKAFKALGLL